MLAALEIVVRTGEVHSALEVAASIALFLVAFGRRRSVTGIESVVMYPTVLYRRDKVVFLSVCAAARRAVALRAFHTKRVFGVSF